MHRPITVSFILAISMIGVAPVVVSCAAPQSVDESHADAPSDAIHNLHQLNDRLYSGAEPLGERAYRQLASLGITTVVSVDAVEPDKQLADRYGIRVIHLPIGYDGIPEDRALALGNAIARIEGSIFMNCHHGKHRGPAALAVGAICAGEITNKHAEDFLTLAGTSPNYPGLWESIRSSRPIPHDQLLDDSIDLPEFMPIGSFVDAMGALDRLNDQMHDLQEIGFGVPEDHPDIVPAAIAGQMHNILRTLEHDSYTQDQDDQFAILLIKSIAAASEIEESIKRGEIADAELALESLLDSCVQCHKLYRNDP